MSGMIPLGVLSSAGAMGGVKLTNMLINSDFSNGLVGWSGIDSTRAEVAGVASVTTTGVLSSSGATSHHLHQAHPITSGKKYYLRARVKSQASHYLRITTAAVASVVTPTDNVWRTLSGIYASGVTVPRAFGVVIGGTEHPYVFEADQFVAIDLTDAFGAGNEPSKATMDLLLMSKFPATNGWFDGTTYLDMVMKDSFNRPQGPLGFTDTGQLWETTPANSFAVGPSNTLRQEIKGEVETSFDTGATNVEVSFTYAGGLDYLTCVARYQGPWNSSTCYRLTWSGGDPATSCSLARRVNGTNTLLTTIFGGTSFTMINGDRMRLFLDEEEGGTRVILYRNDSIVVNTLDTTTPRPLTGTRVGFVNVASGDRLGLIDDLEVRLL